MCFVFSICQVPPFAFSERRNPAKKGAFNSAANHCEFSIRWSAATLARAVRGMSAGIQQASFADMSTSRRHPASVLMIYYPFFIFPYLDNAHRDSATDFLGDQEKKDNNFGKLCSLQELLEKNNGQDAFSF